MPPIESAICIALVFLTLTPTIIYALIFSRGLNLNYASIWILVYFTFGLVSVIAISTGKGLNSYFLNPISDNPSALFKGALSIIFSGIAPIWVFFITTKKLGFKINKYPPSPRKPLHRDIISIDIIYFIAIVCVSYQLFIIHPSPLTMSLTGHSALDIAIRRIETTRDISNIGSPYIISFGKMLILLASLAYAYIYKNTGKRRMAWATSFFIASLSILSSSEKAPLAWFFLSSLLAYKMGTGEQPRFSLKYIIITLLSILGLYVLFYRDHENSILELASDRIFIAQAAAPYLAFDYYHNFFGDIGFSSLNNFFTSLAGLASRPPASEILLDRFFPEMVDLGGWNVNGIYIHEAWANFGIVGLIFFPILVGVINGIIFTFLAKSKPTPINAALLSFASANCTPFLTSANAYIYNSEAIIILIIIASHFLISKTLHQWK